MLSYGGDLTDSQYQLLDQVANTKKIPDLYDGCLCDPVKWYINDEGNQQQIADHPMAYLKLWFEIGLQNPLIYLDAYIAQTQGYWNPNIYYPTYQQERYPADARLYSGSPLNDFLKHTVLYSLPDALRKLPAIGILWSPALYSGMLVILLGAALLRKRPILPFVPCFAVLLTVLISAPIFAEFRYIYALVTAMPLLAGIACYDAFESATAPDGGDPTDVEQADKPAEP